MKKIIFSLSILAAWLLCSCSDLLVEKPQAIAVETFYNTAGEIEAGVAAIYSPIRDAYRNGEYTAMLEESSDIIFEGRGSWFNPSQFQGLDATNVTRTASNWSRFYLAIRNANIMVRAIPNAKSVPDNDKDRFMGESKFLRALAYFQLVRGFGAIPLRTEENMEEYSLPRTPETEIYRQIIADLEFAETALPTTVALAGHPTRWSAKMLLADVYFNLNQYDRAAEKSNEVIQSQQYSLVEVATTDDFEKLYGAAVVTTPEEIFYCKYVEQEHFEVVLYFHGVGGQYIRGNGYYCIISNENYCMYVNQDDNDLRKGLWYPYSGHDPGTLLLKKYTDLGATAPRNSYPLYRYADCLLLYAEASCQTSNAPTAAGLEALNMVHRRAYGYPPTQPSPVDFKLSDYTKETFIELCMKERGYETVGEAKRWLDLKRLGKETARRYVREHRGMEIAEKHFLWPIPVTETNYNDAITDQNPGY